MKIRGDTIKCGRPLLTGRLYRITDCRTIVFEEKDTNDMVNIHFCLKDGQYAVYGNEYKPPFIEDNGGKKADILIMLIDERQEKFVSWVFDVKKTVGGEDVIYHLVEQLLESIKYKKSIAACFDDFAEEEHIGYITQELQRNRIKDTFQKKEQRLKEKQAKIPCLPQLVGITADRKLLNEKAKLKVLRDFINDCITDGKREYKLECYISNRQNNTYVSELNIFI